MAAGRPWSQSYELGLYILGASQPFQTVSIGKPNPGRHRDHHRRHDGRVPGMANRRDELHGRCGRLGPGGVARSTRSNTFNFTGIACSFNVSSTSLNAPATGGSYATTVATSSGCAWTGVSNNTSWITVTGGSSGSWQRHGELHRRRQHVDQPAHWDADDCRADGDGHAGRRVRLHRRADDAKRAGGGRVALGGGYHDERLRLDRREQQHELDHRHERQQWHRQLAR